MTQAISIQQSVLYPDAKQEPLTRAAQASNIFKSVFSAIDNHGVEAAKNLHDTAEKIAGAADSKCYNIVGIIANSTAALFATLARVTSTAIAALAGSAAVIIGLPVTIFTEIARRIEAVAAGAIPKEEAAKAAEAEERKRKVEMIKLCIAASGTESKSQIESALTFIENLVPTRKNKCGADIVEGMQEDEKEADLARKDLRGRLAQINAASSNKFIKRVAQGAVAALAVGGVVLGAAALYKANLATDAVNLLTGSAEKIASSVSALNIFKAAAEKGINTVETVAANAAALEGLKERVEKAWNILNQCCSLHIRQEHCSSLIAQGKRCFVPS